MDFSQPYALFVFIPFLVLFFLLKKIEKKRYLDIPTSIIVKRISRKKFVAKKTGSFLWLLTGAFLSLALSGPRSITVSEKMFVEGRMMVLSIDLSTSMSGTSYSKTKRPSVDVIKELSLKFAERRASTDLVGITAYGGKSYGRNNGQAAVILLPTSEAEQIKASIKMLKPQMLGAFTSIGEGLLVSVLSSVDYEVLKATSVPALIKSLDSEDKAYALEFVGRAGIMKNYVIVLFTDGKNNCGIEPEKVLWLAKMLGIKVYFASLESTGATGLSEAEEERQKNMIIKGVLATGGIYSEMNIVENVESFFDEVDRLETARLEFGEQEKKTPFYGIPLAFAFVSFSFVLIFENLFPRIQ